MAEYLIFNNTSRAGSYGIGTYAACLSSAIRKMASIRVTYVLMFTDDKEFRISIDGDGMRSIRVPAPPSGKEDETYCRLAYYFISRNIDAGERHVFHFNYFTHKPLAVLLKGAFPESRVIFTVHYLGWCFELNGNLTRMRGIMSERGGLAGVAERNALASFAWEKDFLSFADDIIVLSRRTRETLKDLYGLPDNKLHLVYNGVGNCVVPRENTDSPYRNILYVGRLDEIKGIEYLISAFKKIADIHNDIRLLIVGDGDFQRYLSMCRGVHDRISFLGRMERDELENIYKSAYIGVIPSFHEQCSYTAIEMMRHCIPLIGTDTTGLAEMLEASPRLIVRINEECFDEDGFIEDIASRMDALLSDKTGYIDACKRAGDTYLKRHRASGMIRTTHSIISGSAKKEPPLYPPTNNLPCNPEI